MTKARNASSSVSYENHKPLIIPCGDMILPLSQDSLGIHTDTIPELPGTYCPEAENGLIFKDDRRQIAPIPGHPGFLMRWVSHYDIDPKGGFFWDEKDWRSLIDRQMWHFRMLTDTGLQVLPHQHSHILFEPAANVSTLYTIVPNISKHATLCPTDVAHGRSIERWIRGLIDYSQSVIDNDCPDHLVDIYATEQWSVAGDGVPLLHDIEPYLENVHTDTTELMDWTSRVVYRVGEKAAGAAIWAGDRQFAAHMGALIKTHWHGPDPSP